MNGSKKSPRASALETARTNSLTGFPTERSNLMTEATPPPEHRDEKQPRDAAFWAQRVERLEVSDACGSRQRQRAGPS